MGARISPRDQAVIDALNERVRKAREEPLAATRVVGNSAAKPAADEVLRRDRERWRHDGSVVIGRVDTKAGQRIYVGTMPQAISLFEIGTLVLPVERATGLGLWASSGNPRSGDVVLLRHLVVEGWTITDSRDEFDSRRAQARTLPPSMANEADSDPWGLRMLLAAAQVAMADATAQLDRGGMIPPDAIEALNDWNRSLSEAAMDVGLVADSFTIESVLDELRNRDRAWREQMSDLSGRVQALERLDAAISLGGPAAPHLAALREEMAASLTKALANLLAHGFMAGAGGSSAQGAVWQPAEELAERYLHWRADHPSAAPMKDALVSGLDCEPAIAVALWKPLMRVHRALATSAGDDSSS